MSLNLLESLIYGLISGLTEILPVSGQAHRNLMLQLLGESGENPLLSILIHFGVLGALYYHCQNHILRMIRAQKLAKIPKRRRRRPLDTRSLMDISLLKTMVIPVIFGFIFYNKTNLLAANLLAVAGFMFLNGLILYIPQYLPGSNKDSRNLSRVEGVLMGLGGAASVLPGVSSVGTVFSIGTVCGGEKGYVLNMALLLNIGVTAAHVVWDVIALISGDAGALSFGLVLNYLLAAAAAFGGVYLGIRIVRALSAHMDFFAYYCWGAALFTFILYLNI